MQTEYCDRCGIEIEGESKEVRLYKDFPKGLFHKDVCDDCFNKIKDFING